jgi:hypothetical protein
MSRVIRYVCICVQGLRSSNAFKLQWLKRMDRGSLSLRTKLMSADEIRSHTKSVFITPWPKSASEVYLLSDRRLLTKLVRNFTDRGYHVVSVTARISRLKPPLFLSSSSSVVLTMLSGSRSRPTTSQKIW